MNETLHKLYIVYRGQRDKEMSEESFILYGGETNYEKEHDERYRYGTYNCYGIRRCNCMWQFIDYDDSCRS